MKIFYIALFFGSVLLLTGCGKSAGLYQTIVDGPQDTKYHTDLGECQQLAAKRSYLNDDVKSTALLGAGIGTLAGALEDGVGGAVGGAVAGGVIGGGTQSWDTRDEKKNIIIECMKLRGHRVVESSN